MSLSAGFCSFQIGIAGVYLLIERIGDLIRVHS